ncbi:MAG: 2-C-methyl-D-erythritol 2,4-cyclodiphosphate synthase, partial [Bdellovibrionales bacterium]|nr:2-C-methyl-D-erythritol 2,4-cyclodiphosphate synthase [Bdellovibrionales bacterium]
MENPVRIGYAIDVHRFLATRPLVLGGVRISETNGLDGHSDADVVLHAIADAVLGALAWGDIGGWFPNTDPTWKDADSTKLLAAIWTRVQEEGWRLGNVDVMVLAEQPKLAPHIPAMRKAIAAILDATDTSVSIKATTAERLG